MIGIRYGDTSLQEGGVTVTETDVYSSPDNNVQAEKLAEADGSVIVKQQWASKKFSVAGYLQTDTIAETDALIDDFKIALSQKNQAFDIDYAGSTRRYLATPENIIISRSRGLTTAGFTVNFISPDGVGWDVDSSALLAPTTVTSATSSMSMTVGGSYQAEPLITVTVTTVTGGTSKTLTISNGTTLRGLSITRTWANGDVVEIDSYKKTVYVNNAAVDFSGQFPSWAPGTGDLTYLDDFTTRSAIVRADYTKRWL